MVKTTCQIFADKGDPWITEREREVIYHQSAGEHPATENPDMDRWTKASFRPKEESNRKSSIFAKVKPLKQAQTKDQRITRNQQIMNRLGLRLRAIENRTVKG